MKQRSLPTQHRGFPVPRIYSVMPEIIDNPSTLHYSRLHYGNANFHNVDLDFVAVTG
jgi:hypothetical protein